MRFYIFIFLFFFGSALFSQELPVFNIDSIVVSAGANSYNSFRVGRTVSIISNAEMDKLPAKNFIEVLKIIPGIDIRRRGEGDVQADLSIRGSSFEQTLILLDGIPMTDSQTGHHSLDLPVPINTLERIEVLKGSGARVFGANAFGGVVNLITDKRKKDEIETEVSFGSNKSLIGSIRLQNYFGKYSNRFCASISRSDGYRFNTAYKNYNVSYYADYNIDSATIFLSTAFSEKKFGANGFYSLVYPEQWEYTKSGFAIGGLDYMGLNLRIYYKLHDDEYLLYKDQPEKYRNHHIKSNIGLSSSYKNITDYGLISYGIEFGQDALSSNNLSNHFRNRLNFFCEDQFEFKRMLISIGTGLHFSSEWNPYYSPCVDFSYSIRQNLMSFFSINSSFRVPTYTELFYKSPVTLGNPDLKPEKAVSLEFGTRFHTDQIMANLAFFRRYGNELIDWIRMNGSEVWVAQNLTKINTTGLEISLEVQNIHPKIEFLESFKISYAIMSSEKTISDFESRYILDYLRQQVVVEFEHPIIYEISNFAIMRYEERAQGQKYFVCDAKIGRSFKSCELNIDICNIFDRSYTEIGGIPMPGRFINLCFKAVVF